jgi:plasmid stabilization system protein ParE
VTIVVRPDAAADIEEAFPWYERRGRGLGDDFLAALQLTLGRITAHPARYAVIHRNTRRAFLRRFPYGVFYRLYGETIVIVACLHAKRDPNAWRSRA